MITKEYRDMLAQKSAIRELFDYGRARAAEVGADNVFDYSLGNPSVPAPRAFNEALARLALSGRDIEVHGYSPSMGIPAVREAIAASLKRRFALDYRAEHIFLTTGAAGALAHALRAVAAPGSEVVTVAPYFPEYGPYVAGAGCTLRVVPAQTADFQIDLAAMEAALSPKTAAVLLNSPNNPSGAIYSMETLVRLADMLEVKQREFGHAIYLISDEPYREILFAGQECPSPARFYANTLTC